MTEEYILTELMKFATVHEDYGLIITERNAERFAEDLVKNCSIPDVVGRSEQLFCECCEDSVVEEQGDWCQECLENPSRVITK